MERQLRLLTERGLGISFRPRKTFVSCELIRPVRRRGEPSTSYEAAPGFRCRGDGDDPAEALEEALATAAARAATLHREIDFLYEDLHPTPEGAPQPAQAAWDHLSPEVRAAFVDFVSASLQFSLKASGYVYVREMMDLMVKGSGAAGIPVALEAMPLVEQLLRQAMQAEVDAGRACWEGEHAIFIPAAPAEAAPEPTETADLPPEAWTEPAPQVDDLTGEIDAEFEDPTEDGLTDG